MFRRSVARWPIDPTDVTHAWYHGHGLNTFSLAAATVMSTPTCVRTVFALLPDRANSPHCQQLEMGVIARRLGTVAGERHPNVDR